MAGKAGCGEGVGGVAPPTGGVWGATPRKIKKKSTPIFSNLRHSVTIYRTFSKCNFFRNSMSKF